MCFWADPSCFTGFDDQINNNKKLADEAIKKLPGIEATIQKATADNTKTQDILDAMAVPYKEAQDMIDALKSNAAQLEVGFWSSVTLIFVPMLYKAGSLYYFYLNISLEDCDSICHQLQGSRSESLRSLSIV